MVSVGDKTISSLNATKLTEHKFDEASAKGIAAFKKDLADALKALAILPRLTRWR